MMRDSPTADLTGAGRLQFRLAQPADAPAVTALINSGYRGDVSRAGWTTEAGLLTGTRIEVDDLRALIEQPEHVVLLAQSQGQLVASVYLSKTGDAAYLGMFVVAPHLQGAGLGKQLMQAAERYVTQAWGAQRLWLTVITLRHELIAFYERRGFVRTGRIQPFPEEVGPEFRLVADLKMEEMEKPLTALHCGSSGPFAQSC